MNDLPGFVALRTHPRPRLRTHRAGSNARRGGNTVAGGHGGRV